MRYTVVVLTMCLLAGCSGSPPKPAMPDGEYRPINRSASQPKKEVFDFAYEGDVLGALPALREVAPQIKVMSSVGVPFPLYVKLNLRNTTLENALRAIGEQGDSIAEVVWNTTRYQGENQVHIRFRNSKTE